MGLTLMSNWLYAIDMTETQITKTDQTTCYVCGGQKHEPTELHAFWSITDAAREFAAMPGGTYPSMTAVETLDPREAVYEVR